MSATEAAIAATQGPAALPRSNGELRFDAPWQSRAFGLAVALSQEGAFAWGEFRNELVAAIAAAGPDDGYYDSWLNALRTVVLRKQLVESAELDSRVQELRAGVRDEVF